MRERISDFITAKPRCDFIDFGMSAYQRYCRNWQYWGD
jgi:hypothetical protein